MRKRKLTQKLLDKSQESFLLAIEIYNKPTIGFRPETFSILFTTAWELLLKAYIFEQSEGKKLSIFRAKRRNEPLRRTIELDACLDTIFTDGNHPVKRNIEFISEVRNEACHLYIDELSPLFSRAFQSGVVNYCNHIKQWFEIDIIGGFTPGMVSLVVGDTPPGDATILRRKYSQEDVNAILTWNQKYQELVELGSQAALGIEYKLAITKSPNEADFPVSISNESGGQITIVSRLRNPDSEYPYKSKQVIEEVRVGIWPDIHFSSHDLQAFIYANQITKKTAYYYKSSLHPTPQFSRGLVEFICASVSADQSILHKNRSQYRSYLNARKASRR